ncbi:dehydrodolichyl diphosphate synthase complex subunit Nus1 [Ceratina calcarata]|uniref:ditrans,polycis-polyprenyl diphosphate synthase [(2E,6E)-farnesyldiphosphate specific] n=1 Tax=Ceratina calcarata TaxID=156304 RepID=A0AAJ7IYD2_9HYME|nr:dehydrodolichyl diphosphate synthase complex subunit Nus1 [Ceratina calcarata]
MFTVFRILLILIHFSCDLYHAIHNCCANLHRKCMEVWCGDDDGNSRRTEVEIIKCANGLRKLPKHLVVIFGTKEDTVFDCVKIIGWCVALGVPYISFFDITGYLVRNESLLKYELAKRKGDDLLERIVWTKPNAGYTENGITGPKSKIRVSLLSPLDGKSEIVSLTRTLAEAVLTGTIKPEEIDIDLLDEKLNSRGVPDPDLGLIYGRVNSTYGVLPWQTRVTEFFTLPLSHSRLSANDFVYVLEKYSKCQQRHGK